jgi:hypothetical protein
MITVIAPEIASDDADMAVAPPNGRIGVSKTNVTARTGNAIVVSGNRVFVAMRPGRFVLQWILQAARDWLVRRCQGALRSFTGATSY